MPRVLGIDPGTVSIDVCGLNDGALFLDRNLRTAEVARDPEALLRAIQEIGPLDLIAGPSGYGLPLVPIGEVGEREIRLAFLARPGEPGGVGGFRTLVRRMREAALPVVFTPGSVHLPTVPAHRKANRVDLGTADKVCAAALAIAEQAERLGIPFAETGFVLVELGGAFTAVLSVQGGRIVSGIGGSSGPPGYRAGGAMDGEVAYLLGPIGKEVVFAGGAAWIAGRPDESPEQLAARDDDEAQNARAVLIEGVVRAVAGELAIAPDAREILLSGRLSGVPAFADPIAERLGRFAPVRRVEGFAKVAKHAAQGAALIADGACGRTARRAGRDDAAARRGGHGAGSSAPARRHRGNPLDRGGSRLSDRILIVGVSTRALAESAARAGYRCVTVDAFGDRDQRRQVPNRALGRDRGRRWNAAAAVALAADLPANAVAYTANLENYPDAVRRLACGRELLGSGPAVLRRVRDPWQLADAVREGGARAPALLRASEAATADPRRNWLRKPIRGGGGSGVMRWQPGEPVGERELLQERIDGVLASASFAADGQRAVLLGMAEQMAGKPTFGADGFRFCGSEFPLAAFAGNAERLRERMQRLAQALTECFGLRGVNGVDFVLRDGRPYVLEVNPRPTASMELMERACGISIFETHLRACRGKLPAVVPAPAGVHGKAILYARRDVVIGNTDGWLEGDRVRDIPFPGDRIRRGHPICTVFASAADAPRCRAALRAEAAALEREMYG